MAAQQAIAHSRRTHFGFEPVFQVVEAEALISLGRINDAIGVLGDSIESCRSSGLRAYDEWGQTLMGQALLVKNEDERAATVLNTCVDHMSKSNRLLLLPAAATFLAEANRRLGERERREQSPIRPIWRPSEWGRSSVSNGHSTRSPTWLRSFLGAAVIRPSGAGWPAVRRSR